MDIDFSHWTNHSKLISWINEMVTLCKPNRVHLCDGSQEEYDHLAQLLISQGVFVPLAKRPGSFWCRSDPADVARVEERTFICTKRREEAGPTNNWADPEEMKEALLPLFNRSMKGRTLYVVPFCMGPLSSPYSIIGVEITDSPYVVCNMRIMTRMGVRALERLGRDGPFVPSLHSCGMPLEEGAQDVPWPCNKEKYIVHFPEERLIWSYGSGYGGNALLGKKCLALRIASYLAKEEGWLAEHMLIVGVTNPEGVKRFFTAAFPSACGKTNLAMLRSTLPGWKIECVGDDIAWMHFNQKGELRAINPEAGFFGVAPGTSECSNPSAMKSIERNTIFTNTALTDDGDVWWEGMTKVPPSHLKDWQGREWTSGSREKASHPNARFTAPAAQCPVLDPAFDDPEGVPIAGIIFGGRRASTIPLVTESLSWAHGVFMGASVSSERTAAAAGKVGEVRHDPFAMLPFCGYNMGDYFAHWIEMGKKVLPEKLPKIFYVNWFQKSSEGEFLWPGFGENGRVLKWIFERVEGGGKIKETPIGRVPQEGGLDLSGLILKPGALEALLSVDLSKWHKEAGELGKYFQIFGSHFPHELVIELKNLIERLRFGY